MGEHSIKTYFLHSFLFILTFITTTLAGAEWMFGNSFIFSPQPLGWPEFWQGMYFSIPFLSVLTVHEFGHYITARLYKIRLTLPYYIPFWLGIGSIGTMGAFIRIKSPMHTRQEYFDVGIAGPLAGFILALGVLLYGFTHLPPPEHIFTIHPEYQQYGLAYAQHVYKDTEGGFALGRNLLFVLFEKWVVTDPARIPNVYEMAHYPFLFAGYLSLFFTSLNLLPIGQLDGGHILFSMVGYRKHSLIAPVLFVGFVFYAGLGLVVPPASETEFLDTFHWALLYFGFLFITFSRTVNGAKNTILLSLSVFAGQYLLSFLFPGIEGYYGWLLFSFILGRFLGVYHPPVLYDRPLSAGRQALGWLSLLVFILSFSPKPFIM
ncbi:site-2 protease family protein [Rhodocytophaga aerolata]|uniref:Site-2 protease family protein n=1 Tax=Rhodocytophaga aerolata TaxID=455078 RepID=A0ABT8RAR2_9BACT|nr:site-2 protease family protein [Rhodocytophaga aerolata]MDO1449167.1 site-2 protease family protein [Rhodocytophaga aerolata]